MLGAPTGQGPELLTFLAVTCLIWMLKHAETKHVFAATF